MSYTTLELVRFTINKLNHCHNLSVSKPSFIGQPLWLRSGRHACVIFSLLCASGFSLLSLKQGSNSGMDDRSRFGSFPRRHLLFAEDTSTEQLRFARHLYHSDWVIRKTKKGYTYNRLSYYSNHVSTFNIEFICCHGDIHPHPGPQNCHRNLRVSSERSNMAYANSRSDVSVFYANSRSWLTRLIS